MPMPPKLLHPLLLAAATWACFGCAQPDDLCVRASDHLQECLGPDAPPTGPSCDLSVAREVLAQDCATLGDAGKADRPGGHGRIWCFFHRSACEWTLTGRVIDEATGQPYKTSILLSWLDPEADPGDRVLRKSGGWVDLSADGQFRFDGLWYRYRYSLSIVPAFPAVFGTVCDGTADKSMTGDLFSATTLEKNIVVEWGTVERLCRLAGP